MTFSTSCSRADGKKVWRLESLSLRTSPQGGDHTLSLSEPLDPVRKEHYPHATDEKIESWHPKGRFPPRAGANRVVTHRHVIGQELGERKSCKPLQHWVPYYSWFAGKAGVGLA